MKTAYSFVVALVLSACVPAAVAPAVQLGTCEADMASRGYSFADFLAHSVLSCGDDMLALIDAVLKSADPAFAKYQGEAAEAKASPGKMNALKAHVEARRAAAARGDW